MKSLSDNESYQKKLAKQRLAQQRQYDRKIAKQQERLNDSEYMAAEKAKKHAAQKRQIERQQEKLKQKLSDPSYLLQQKHKQQQALKKQQEKALLKAESKRKAPLPTTKPKTSKGMKGRARSAEEKRLEEKLANIGCICCINQGWYTQAMRDAEGQRYISMHHVEGRTKPWAHAKQLPLCHYHHQTPAPSDAPKELFPIHGNAIPVWEEVNGSQESLLQQVYEIIGEVQPWLTVSE